MSIATSKLGYQYVHSYLKCCHCEAHTLSTWMTQLAINRQKNLRQRSSSLLSAPRDEKSLLKRDQMFENQSE